jgi:M6 family metalloprotease-like protein
VTTRLPVPIAACLAALAALALPSPTQAQPREREAFGPLSTLPAVAPPRLPFKERLFRAAARATRPLPHLRRLVAKTQGDMKLAVVLVELGDGPKPRFAPSDYEASLFSRGVYRKTPTGEVAHGSMRDYFLENSSGALDLRGEVHDWVRIEATRARLEPALLADPGARRDLFARSLDAVRARDGDDAFLGVDGVVFVVTGDQAKTRGSILWPHSGVTFHRGRAFRYYLIHAGTKRFEPIGVHCHELGHVLGILDKYGVGSGTGLGQWCLMAQGGHGGRSRGVALDAPVESPQSRLRAEVEAQLKALRERFGGGQRAPSGDSPHEADRNLLGDALPGRAPRSAGKARPLHLCAVCKHRLGWTKPTVIDPRQGVSFYLEPVAGDAQQVAQVLLDPRGRETLYLEYRRKQGFDADLAAPGLLVWRAGSPTAALRTFVPIEQTELVPAHGVRSLDAPKRAVKQIPFPAGEVDAVTVSGTLPGSWTVTVDRISDLDGKLMLRVRRAD